MAVRLSALSASRPLPPRKIPGTHSCQTMSRPQGHSAAGRIRSIEKFHLIGTRTRDLPACSIVPQPTMLPRAPILALLHKVIRVPGLERYFFISVERCEFFCKLDNIENRIRVHMLVKAKFTSVSTRCNLRFIFRHINVNAGSKPLTRFLNSITENKNVSAHANECELH
jgi:hypothetical protein